MGFKVLIKQEAHFEGGLSLSAGAPGSSWLLNAPSLDASK